MGTRADFYAGRGAEAEWLGSIAWDGYPDGIDIGLRSTGTEETYRKLVASFLASRDDATLPEQGWPWPWEDSRTTDYAYAFDGGFVWASCFGHGWLKAASDALDDEGWTPTKTAVFPDMTDRKNVVHGGKRSGLIVVERRRDEP